MTKTIGRRLTEKEEAHLWHGFCEDEHGYRLPMIDDAVQYAIEVAKEEAELNDNSSYEN